MHGQQNIKTPLGLRKAWKSLITTVCPLVPNRCAFCANFFPKTSLTTITGSNVASISHIGSTLSLMCSCGVSRKTHKWKSETV